MNLTDRQDYYDVSLDQVPRIGCNIVQLKYDGWWCRMVVNSQGEFIMYSRTGRNIKSGVTDPNAEGVYIGEYMFGTQWSLKPERQGKLFLFDCWKAAAIDTTSFSYRDRYSLLRARKEYLPAWCELVANYRVEELKVVWDNFVETGNFEGLVFRNSQDNAVAKIFRCKRDHTDVYKVKGVEVGEGKYANMLGALICESAEGHPAKVGGGITDEQRRLWWDDPKLIVGSLIEVGGKGRFEQTGLLRHPNLIRVKDDN